MRSAKICLIILLYTDVYSEAFFLRAEIWSYVGWEDLSSPSPAVRDGIRKSDILTIIATKMRPDGTLQSVGVPTYSVRSENRPLIYPLISFPDRKTGETVLRSARHRATAIRSLLTLAESYDGLHLDFEHLGVGDTGNFEALLRSLYPAMKLMKKILSLAVLPGNFPDEQRGFHDLSRIGPFADQFVLMTYDYHNPATEPGPVSDIKLAEEAIRLALKDVQPSQLWLGVPTYGYSWELESRRFRTLHLNSFRELLKSSNCFVRRHRSQMLAARCDGSVSNGKSEIAFFPDEYFVRLMKLLAERYHLRGTAHWRLYSGSKVASYK